MKSFLREPLVHFFGLALTVFCLFAVFDDTPPPDTGPTIRVSVEDARRLAAEFETIWRRPPQPDELERLINLYVREEIYMREAVALGLDKGDAIIRRRLQQKMEFITESGSGSVEPDDETLAAHLAAHPQRFSREAQAAFEQIMLDETTADAAVSEIKANLDNGVNPLEVARPSLLPSQMPLSTRRVIDGAFGSGFFDDLNALPLNQWSGPVLSSYGRHLIRVVDRKEGHLPSLNDIRARVVADWRTEFADKLREQRYETMRLRYDVIQPSVEEVLGQ